jgi:2-octaprenyl-6-methoxyphenol hydroxylase
MPQKLSQLSDESNCDVLVIGAGMVGASAALGLSKLGLNVVMVDAFNFSEDIPAYTPSYDARSTALSWGTREILEQLEVWQSIEKHACVIEQVHVSEKGRFGTTRMNAQDYNQDALGYVVPNQCIGQSLLAKVYENEVPFYSGVKVTEIVQGVDFHQVRLSEVEGEQSKVLNARLLLVVDGTESSTAKLLGIDYQVEKYSQHALVANVTSALPNQGVAFERFTAKGPLAMLPLNEYDCSLVWTRDESEIQAHLDMSEQEFCKALEDSFSERLGSIERCGERVSYPLRLVRAEEQCRMGVLLLGNAAHSLHPVAGQGFNLAIRGVAAFLAFIKEACHSGSDYRSISALNKFCESRMDDQNKTIALSDQLVKVFANPSPLLNVARDLGLIGLDNLAPLKTAFAQRAMGLADRKAHFG